MSWSAYRPPSPSSTDILPFWILITSAASVYNALQNFVISWQTKEIYELRSAEVTPLAARLFGVWTGLAAVVRFYAAYNITDQRCVYLCQQRDALSVAQLPSGSTILPSLATPSL